MAIERTEPKNPGPHGACECPPDPAAPEPTSRPSKRLVGAPRSVTFTPAQLEWLKANVAPGSTFAHKVRECIQAIMDGAVQPCPTKHCYRRKK